VVVVDQADAKQATNAIVDFGFEPVQQTVPAGTALTWTNTGDRPHTVTDRGGMFDTGAILPGAQATVTLTAPGTYFFFCEINPSRMNGQITVTPGPEVPTELRVQAVDEARDGAAKAFDPATLTVAAGTRVVLANVGGLPHSIVAEDGSFETDVVPPGAEGGRFHGSNDSFIATEPGAHPFFCEIHPAAMKGTLTVTAQQVEADDRAPPRVDRPPATAAVDAIDFAFDLTSTLVAPGGTVTWSNTGAKPHTATFDDVELDTGTIEPGGDAELTAPADPGTYSYSCTIHPAQMRGVLIVSAEEPLAPGEGAQAAPPATETETDGTLLAYGIAVLVIGIGAIGLVLALRRRSA
jgi:plastocyanin